MNGTRSRRIIVGITGASGAAYAKRLVECLVAAEAEVHLVITPHGRRLFADELGLKHVDCDTFSAGVGGRLVIHPYRDVGALIASGSFVTDGMVVCPCSSNTLAAMAAGLADNLLDRAAAVTLKEMRRLVLVTREMPTSRIDLQNALRLNEAGAVICPAAPGFYLHPRTVGDLVDFVVGKVLDLLSVDHDLDTRWAPGLSAHNAEGAEDT